ncbi:predicted protein [Clavispora lusitaniae ATCC 42720]|uniref:Uncharacterized protein n=1 Tax=Clavispora lusitaniae (strain ATCC 42720) TaxID=306902 RepID=C4XZL4_CLAL4|nr:uncharacterized protein CLUG_01396 [Clavispora lusitaniae ATCC 42720]EEQ37273.1 predicted protein [Clavispora lusitaniae ATCC 42720]
MKGPARQTPRARRMQARPMRASRKARMAHGVCSCHKVKAGWESTVSVIFSQTSELQPIWSPCCPRRPRAMPLCCLRRCPHRLQTCSVLCAVAFSTARATNCRAPFRTTMWVRFLHILGVILTRARALSRFFEASARSRFQKRNLQEKQKWKRKRRCNIREVYGRTRFILRVCCPERALLSNNASESNMQ